MRDSLRPRRDRLISQEALFSEGDVSVYSADTETFLRLTYFAISVFWRGAAYRWPIGRDFSQLLQFGPFEDPIRHYLLRKEPLPERLALTVCLSSRPDPPLGCAYPMSYTDSNGFRFHRFHIPGIMFTLYLGNAAEHVSAASMLSAPEHPVWLGSMSDENFMSEIVAFINRNNPIRV